ncbi:MAG TPA: MFS transporter [Rhizomicrobium sp.]|jgi:EmrB/QacA subfamily drug resistance transporter
MLIPLQPCDQAIIRASARFSPIRHQTAALVGLTLSSSLVFLDAATVPVGLAALGAHFNVAGSELQWVLSAYYLPLAALSLLGGAIGDRFGRQRSVLSSLVLLICASVAASLTDNFSLLLVFRFLQGAAASLLLPNSLASLGNLFSGEREGRAIGLWSAVAAIASALGPLLGGWAIDQGLWRLIFAMAIPFGLVALLLTWLYMPSAPSGNSKKIDYVGGLLVTIGLATLVWAVSTSTGKQSSAGWLFLLAAGLLAVFAWWERRRGASAMIPPSLLRSGTFAGLSIYTIFLYGALTLITVSLPFVLVKVAHYSAAEAGAIFIPLQIMLVAVSSTAGRLTVRFGARLPLLLGALLGLTSFVAALRIGEDAGYWSQVLPAILLLAVAMACVAAPLTTLVLTSVDPKIAATASGINSAITRLGSVIASSALSPILLGTLEQIVERFHSAIGAGAICCAFAVVSTFLIPPGTTYLRSGRDHGSNKAPHVGKTELPA